MAGPADDTAWRGNHPLPDTAALVRALADECGMKDAPKGVLGFV